MSFAPPNPIEQERELMARLLDPAVADNPLEFTRLAWRWGQPGTFLHRFKEPRKWQCEELERLGDWVRQQLIAMREGRMLRMYRRAFCSGHGTGKGAFWSIVKHWFRSTRLGASIIDTANTDDQLKTRTWAESEKWFNASVNKHWFDFKINTLVCEPADWFREELKATTDIPLGHYFDRGQMYKQGKSDSWAGIHNERGVMLGIDEASGVPDFISTTSQGFFTDDTLWRIWFQFSQGRHTEGYFYDIQEDPLWSMRHLNALEVEGTDKEFLQGIVDKQGPNSYEARVLVYGLFPDQTEDQFIPHSLVNGAMTRQWTEEHERAAQWEPIVMAVDPSGGGPDSTVIGQRRGLDMRSIPFVVKKGLDVMDVAYLVADEFDRAKPQPAMIVVDSTGLGMGVVARLKEMGYPVTGVNFGSSADEEVWKDKRTELYARARAWLDNGFLPNDKDLKRDLTAPKLERLDGGKCKLTSKRALKRSGLPSPDRGDVVALSFAVPLAKLDPRRRRKRESRARNADYNAINGHDHLERSAA